MNLESFIEDLSEKKIIFSQQHKIELFMQIIEGLCFLSFMNICHRDLKPENILLSRHLFPRIIDFGSSCMHYSESDKMTFSNHRNLLII